MESNSINNFKNSSQQLVEKFADDLVKYKNNELLNDDVYVVAIGASAGGLDAINSFFENMPAYTGLSFVVIQHLPPDHKSLMKDLLSKHTDMKVIMAEDKLKIVPNKVYLIPPGKEIIVRDNTLYVSERVQERGFSLPIDKFLHSLGEDKKDKAIAVILSGSGSDGSKGIKSIHENGGLVIAQSESSAEFVSMPKSAVSTGFVDYVLPPSKMPLEVINYVNENIHLALSPKDIKEDTESLDLIISTVKEYTGMDFFHYKKATILRRIERRMSVANIDLLSDYLNYINNNAEEITKLYKEFFIGVTNFFRDSQAFEIIEKEVIPSIFERKSPGSSIRIWTAGCSTGQEAYSLAILIKEYLNKIEKSFNVKIFATDIDDDSLDIASYGIYDSDITNDISSERLKNFFTAKGDKYQVIKSIRDMVIFAKHNIIKDPPFSKLDLITCRNLLIYLQPQVQQNILSFFNFSLNHNGYLFLGGSETTGDMGKHFSPVNNKWKIFKYAGEGRSSRVSNFSINNIGGYVQEKSYSLSNSRASKNISFTDKSIEKMIQTLQDSYIPKGIIIDESYELIHVLGDVNNYIRIPSNKLSLNILKMIRSDLSIAVGTAVHNVLKENRELRYNNIRIKNENSYSEIVLTVKPYIDEGDKKKFAIILFEEEVKNTTPINEESFELHSKMYQRISDLEQELKYSKEHLQAVIEELESSNEELQATNEELLSSNEELQSTNEELQSVNEELYTVNAEYQLKINELTEAHDDINNLLNITNVSTIFLDKNLCIRRFTPAVKKVINIIESDIGRPISHISTNIKYDDLITDIQSVLNTLNSIDKVVPGYADDAYKVSISPYLATDYVIKGIVINIFDINNPNKK